MLCAGFVCDEGVTKIAVSRLHGRYMIHTMNNNKLLFADGLLFVVVSVPKKKKKKRSRDTDTSHSCD